MTNLKKYKLVVSDFDGTLKRNDDTISEHTKRVIAQFRADGGIFTISTGRMYKAIAPRVSDVGLSGSFPLMSFQGALVSDNLTNETMHSCPLDLNLAIEFLTEAERLGLYCHYYGFDELYVPKITAANTEYFNMNRITPVVVGKVSEHLSKTRLEVAKVLCIVSRENMADAYAKLNAKFGERGQVMVSAPVLLECISNNAGKGNGLKFVANHYGIDLSQTIAIGDEMNDVSMVKIAGLGVAVENASDSLKGVASYITKSNDLDGVAAVIEKFCL